MVSVISDRVLVGYSLSDRSQPRPDDQLELSSHSEELFAIAESSRVDMTDIRDHQPVMSVRRAVPGKSHHYPISCGNVYTLQDVIFYSFICL